MKTERKNEQGEEYEKRGLFVVALILCAALALAAGQLIVLEKRYQAAGELLVEGQYEKAQASYELLGNYKDSAEKARNILRDKDYRHALALMAQGEYGDAMIAFRVLGDYKDSAERAAEAKDALPGTMPRLRRCWRPAEKKMRFGHSPRWVITATVF